MEIWVRVLILINYTPIQLIYSSPPNPAVLPQVALGRTSSVLYQATGLRAFLRHVIVQVSSFKLGVSSLKLGMSSLELGVSSIELGVSSLELWR